MTVVGVHFFLCGISLRPNPGRCFPFTDAGPDERGHRSVFGSCGNGTVPAPEALKERPGSVTVHGECRSKRTSDTVEVGQAFSPMIRQAIANGCTVIGENLYRGKLSSTFCDYCTVARAASVPWTDGSCCCIFCRVLPLITRCPACGSVDVRPSKSRSFDILARLLSWTPYRCRQCRKRFYRKGLGEQEQANH